MALADVRQRRLFEADAPSPVRRAAPVPVPPVLSYPPAGPDWAPDPIPELRGEKRIILNAETNGLKWWHDSRPIGWSYVLPESGRRGYLPMRHVGGDNHSVEQVHAFMRDVRGMHVENANTKFDLHMSRADGVDLVEGTGNTFGDAAHYAALLDDNRMRFNLDQLSKDVLDWDVATDGLGPLPPGCTSEGEWHKLPARDVSPYAIRNVTQVERLIDAFGPRIHEDDLDDVLGLEQEVLPATVEMEKNGTWLDQELLHRWRRESTTALEENLYRIYQLTGLSINSPDSSKDWEALYRARGIPITARTEHGAPSFTDAVVKHVKDEAVQAMRAAGQLADLKSKYLDKYDAAMRGSDGWLRFNLHQLRYGRDEGEKFGTVSGRFSAAGDGHYLKPDGFGSGGYNPQQVVAVEKQLERGWCPDYVVRRLFVAPPGMTFFAADMAQIEYRLFAHYADTAQAYHARPEFYRDAKGKIVWTAGPLADYHAVVAKLLSVVAPHLNRKLVKNINFAKIYGAGLLKFAFMLGLITEAKYKELLVLQRMGHRVKDREELREARETMLAYDTMFPAVAGLLRRAGDTAKNRGYVKDLMGRRARLLDRFHSALNRIIQGGAASINKRYLVEVYKERKRLGLQMALTVHDELGGYLAEASGVHAMKRLLNRQYFNLRAPVMWDCKIGANWAACK